MVQGKDRVMAKKVIRDGETGLIDEPRHHIYAGPTMCGKTTLARFHSRLLCSAGHHVIVYDPVGTHTAGSDEDASPEQMWAGEKPKGRVTFYDDPEKFTEAMAKEENAFVFIDESADIHDHTQVQNQWMLRRGRHAGLYFRLMVQRVKMIPPNVRTQCTRAYLFRMAKKDANEILSDFGHESDIWPDSWEPGDCLMIESASDNVEQFNVFVLTGGDPNFVEKVDPP
jgi:hypothetical protein